MDEIPEPPLPRREHARHTAGERKEPRPVVGLGSGAPVTEIAEGTAARVAGFLTLVAAGPIAWLYTSNIAQTGNTAEPERLPSRTASEQRSAAA